MSSRMRRSGLTRRSLLRGLLAGGAAVTVGLPALEIFLNSHGTAYASGEGFPARFGLFFWGNGVLPDKWIPQGEGANWALSEQLQPLANVKDMVTVVSGMAVKTGNPIPHHSGVAGLLSGTVADGDNHVASPLLPTIDQLIANEIGQQTRFKSIEFGTDPGLGVSFSAYNTRNPPEQDPYALFERIFGAGFRAPGEDAVVDPTIALRRSVLDAVVEDANKLRGELGASDRLRLEQHLEGVRELELRLARLEEDPPDLASCRRGEAPLPEYPDIDGRPQVSLRNRAMCDTMALALACDQTRVFSNYFSRPLSNILYQGASAGHHRLTHDEPGDQPEVHKIVLKIITEYAYMLETLRAIPEGDETLLDHCAVMGCSEISRGRNHSLDEMPILIGGSACGRLAQGIHYRSFSGENTSRLMLTMMRAMGISATEFGMDAGRATEGLSGVEV